MGVGVVAQDTRQHHREGKEKVLFLDCSGSSSLTL